MTTAAAAAPIHPTAYSNSSDINGSLLELFQEVLVKPVQVVIDLRLLTTTSRIKRPKTHFLFYYCRILLSSRWQQQQHRRIL